MAEKKQVQNFISVDIGSFSIKIVELKKDENTFEFVHHAIREFQMPEKARQEEIQKILSEELQSSQFTAQHIIVFANLPSLNLHMIQFPDIPEDEIKKSSRFKAKNLVPYSLADAYYDCIINERIGMDNRVNAMFISALKTEVESVVELFGKKKKNVSVCSIRSLGIQNILTYTDVLGEHVVHVDIGHEQTIVNIFHNKKQQFSRNIPMGFHSIKEAAIKEVKESETGIESAEENIDEKFEIIGFVEDKLRVDLSDEDTVYADAIEEGLSRLIQRIRLTLGYFKTQSKVSKFDVIYLSGGGSNITGITDYFKIQFAVETEYLTLPENIENCSDAFKKDFLLCAPSVGIHYGKENSRLNLIPEDESGDAKKWKGLSANADAKELWLYAAHYLEQLKYPKLVYGILAIIIIGSCIAHFMFAQYEAYAYKKEKSLIEKQIRDLNSVNIAVEQFEQYKKEIQREGKVIEQHFKDNIKFDDVLNELLKTIWETVTVKQLNYKIGKKYTTVDDERITETEYIIILTARCKDVSQIKKVKNDLSSSEFFVEVNAKDSNFIKEKTKNGIETFVDFVMSVKIDPQCEKCFYTLDEIAAMKAEMIDKKEE